jgi:hypothetical protein
LNRAIYTTILLFFAFLTVRGQTTDRLTYIQVSGLIVDASYRPVPGVAVISRKLKRGTVSEKSGIYSIPSTRGDTIFFRALGFKRYHTIIPEDYNDRHCKVDIVLENDTIQIAEVTILPWKTYSEFLTDMTKERKIDPIVENMNDNIASIYVAVAKQTGVNISPEAGFRQVMEQNFVASSTRNQYPVNNLLNPLAWAKFVKGVKNGLFKNQKFDKPVNAKVRKKVKNPDK